MGLHGLRWRIVAHFCAGGVAGMAARTVIAPIERAPFSEVVACILGVYDLDQAQSERLTFLPCCNKYHIQYPRFIACRMVGGVRPNCLITLKSLVASWDSI